MTYLYANVVPPTEHPLSPSLRFLATTSKTLASSYDFVRTLSGVGDALVPAFADGFRVTITSGAMHGTIVNRGTLTDPDAFADIRLPLVSRARELGTLLVASRGDGNPGSTFDRQTFEELALRIAVAIDGAGSYAEQSPVETTLTYTLLPDRLPDHPRLRFDAAYLPGESDAIVGGDWYDAFELPDGRIACSIGDVAGHGLRAALIMGEVREALRDAARDPGSPAQVLERANAVLNARENAGMVTAAFAVIDPATATFTYALAGHPAPMLALADGSVQSLPGDGVPLGVAPRVDASNWTFTIPPGSLLVLYTDGLIEFGRDVIGGLAHLTAALGEEIAAPNRAAARSLVGRVFDTAKNTDDVAVLAVSAAEHAEREFAFTFSAVPVAVPLVRRAYIRYLRALPLGEDDRFAVVTAAGEAIANAVEHAYVDGTGTVSVHTRYADGVVYASIEDHGFWRTTTACEERGRGFLLMRSLMTDVEIEHGSQGTTVRLRLLAGPVRGR